MQCTLTPSKAVALDRIIRITAATSITLDTAVTPAIIAAAPDLSHYTIIRLEPSFFELYQPLHTVVTLPAFRLARAGMQSLNIIQSRHETRLCCVGDGFVHTKTLWHTEPEVLDIDFEAARAIVIDAGLFKAALQHIQTRQVTLSVICGADGVSRSLALVTPTTRAEFNGVLKDAASLLGMAGALPGTTTPSQMHCAYMGDENARLAPNECVAQDSVCAPSVNSYQADISVTSASREPLSAFCTSFTLRTEVLRRTISVSDIFEETILVLPVSEGALCVMHRGADATVSSYIAA